MVARRLRPLCNIIWERYEARGLGDPCVSTEPAIRMTGLFKTILAPLREFGFFAGSVYGINQVFIRSNSRFRVFLYDLMIQPVAQTAIASRKLTGSVKIREICDGDAVLQKMPPPDHVIASRFKQGAICIGAFQKGHLIGYQWLRFGTYQEDEVRCDFVPRPEGKTVFDFDIYVYPKYRLGIGFAALWDGSNSLLRSREILYAASRVSRFNTASMRSHRHLGCQRIGRVLFVTGKQWQWLFATGSPFVHLSLNAKSRPRISIGPSQS